MTGIGTGYDLSSGTFSPDGRIFQIEYAAKAVEKSGTVAAVCVKDGVVFGVEKIVASKMLVEGSNRRVHRIAAHIGLAITGLVTDGRQLVNAARSEAENWARNFGLPIPVKTLVDRLAQRMHAYTMYSSVRPFGTTIVVGGIDPHKGPQVFTVEPSGMSWGFYGCSAGKGKQLAKTEIEKLKLKDMSCEDAVHNVARILYSAHNDIEGESGRDKDFEIELAWVGAPSNNMFAMVPEDTANNARRLAKAAVEEGMDTD
eukprot:CAMPEP_0177664772 /NCGR_PEP_ID=MMETSP0447-20121125/20688_1 /TAXON_ID=0 /ORGANISM="Stygamoeba regulata, Strain BSH-02190019" /LENGTH=256 /DNA_ID=CAMNT_0019170799 /DNA_START=42 /DNA_END=812 /DNA_ORIENTATION=-